MHDVTRSAAKNRVELVLARRREALVSAILQARKAVAVIPAPGPLANVTRQSAGIADLGRSDALGRFRQHGVLFADLRVVAKRIQRNQPADLHLAGLRL